MSDPKSNRLSDTFDTIFHSPTEADPAINDISINDGTSNVEPCNKSKHISSTPPKYIKLNIGGRLYITTFETICSADWMISRMLKSEIPSTKDENGFIVIDRCGTHFEYFLEFLREGQLELPSNYKILNSLLLEAKFYCFQEFCQLIETKLIPKYHHEMKETYIINVQCPEHLYRVIKNTTKPIICLTLNRQNNKYSYVEKADDNFVRHNELFHRLNSRFQGIADFVIDTGSDQYEVCTWRFYSADGEKRAEISCASIVYTPDRKQTKVDFPEARIYEEALNALLRHCGVATYKEMPTKKDGSVM
jgi:BTB/POZ domain-containing adapter for CUL3-mediated RhoA degradation protein